MNACIRMKNFWQRYGFRESAVFLLFKFLQKTFNLDRQEIVLLELADLTDKKNVLPANYKGGFIDYETLRVQVAKDPALEMNEEFLSEAIVKKDLCYAISNDEGIVSYGWYSRKPTKMNGRLYFYFDNHYAYRYKGVTKLEFRGERLHAIGMASALQSPQLRNSRGLVFCVERQNLASLKSVYRMGYRRTGSIYVLHLFGTCTNYSTPGCKLTKAHTKRRGNAKPIEAINVKA